MQVSDSYYEDEVRDGFYIPGMMKRAWAASVEVFEEVARICEEYGIQYFADAGTLLGAVRHQGFIPWDDDFDICMKREDYNQFIRIARDELPERFSLLNIYTEPEYDEMFPVWSIKNRFVLNRNIWKNFRDFHLLPESIFFRWIILHQMKRKSSFAAN